MSDKAHANNGTSAADPGVKAFTPVDFIVILLLLSFAVYCVNLFRLDLLQSIDARKDDPAGTIIKKDNIVQRRLADRVVWDRLYTHSSVYPGDLIHVAQFSAATLELGKNRIELNENTLIRILRAADGEDQFRIELTEGALKLTADDTLMLNVAGRQVQASSGTKLNITTGKNGTAVQVSEGSVQFSGDGLDREIASGGMLALDSNGAELSGGEAAALASVPRNLTGAEAPALISPIQDSLFRYLNDPPNLPFQWSEAEDASYYIMEVCDTPDFINPRIKRQTTASSIVIPDMEEGTWYCRVSSVYPSIYEDVSEYSSTVSFRIEQTNDPLAPALELPELQIVPAAEVIAEKAVEPPPARPQPAPRPQPPPPLPAPGNRRPAEASRLGVNELRAQQGVAFSWSEVAEANAYILTLYQQTAGRRRQIIRRELENITHWTLTDLSLLDMGTFIWQVEAVSRNRGGAIERRGRIEENTFIVDIPPTARIEVEDTGVLYGN